MELDGQSILEMLEEALDRPLESVDLAADFYDYYGLDSMGAVVLFIEIQRRLGIEISADQMKMLRNGANVIEFVSMQESGSVLE